MKPEELKTVFLDIGGVLLTDGWNREARDKAYRHFNLMDEKAEINERHDLNFDTYEMDKITLDNYLENVIFYKKRKFSKDEFFAFMLEQSKELSGGAIKYFSELKKKHNLKIIALSNEARDLNEYRIKTFKLDKLFDAFVSSCYTGMRKPDPKMYKMASDISATPFNNAVYIDDRIIYIGSALKMGLPSLHYSGIESAQQYFGKLGLE